jgi:two-component system, NtrC family, sensor kinase
MLALVFAVATVTLARRCSRLMRHARRATRHRAAVARLRRAAELSAANRYWTQIRQASAPILVTSPDGKVLAASAPVTEMFGYRDEEEFRGVSMDDLYVDALDRSRYLSARLREHGEIRSAEFRMKHRDGHQISVLSTARVVVSADGTSHYEGVLTDITALRTAFEERQQLEAQLHLARKLELVGRLASGIAHEINTPMQFIGDNISFLKRAFGRLAAQLTPHGPADPGERPAAGAPQKLPDLLADVAEALEGSLEGVDRVSETVRAMKEFAHPEDIEVTSTDLNQAIRTTLVVARNEYKHAAEVKLELGEIQTVDCRRAEINKVFLNLIVNAAHAIEASARGRGTITIRSATDGGCVRIDVSDTGCGIPAAVLPRIFDPFFTTKAIGKGSGQGLAIARTVIRKHGGDLDVTSTVGRGTTFTVRLPVAPSAAPAAGAPLAMPPDLEESIG